MKNDDLSKSMQLLKEELEIKNKEIEYLKQEKDKPKKVADSLKAS